MPRKSYSDAALARAVERVVVDGESATLVGPEVHIPYRTLLKYVARHRRGESIVNKRRGPPPALSQEGERELLLWMRELQAAGLPVRRRELIVKANEVLKGIKGPEAQISSGWYSRFRSRHLEISGPGSHMVIAQEEKDGEEEEKEEGVGKRLGELEGEGLLLTSREKAVFAVQESYAALWSVQDVVDAIDLMLDAEKADMFLVMTPGELRDMWVRKQLRLMQRASR